MDALTALGAAQVAVLLAVSARIVYLGVARRDLLRRKTVVLSAGTALLLASSVVLGTGVPSQSALLAAEVAAVLAYLLLTLAFLGPVTRSRQEGLLIAFYANVLLLMLAANSAGSAAWPWRLFPLWKGGILVVVLGGLAVMWRRTRFGAFVPLVFGVGLLFVATAAGEWAGGGVVAELLFLSAYLVFGWGVLGLVDFREVSSEQQVFRVAYMPEDIGSKSQRNWKLSPGSIHLLHTAKPHPAFTIFCDQVTHGLAGLVISRHHPKQIRQRYGLAKTPLHWLADTHPDDKARIPPKPERIYRLIEDFVSDDEPRVVLLEGLEFLASHTSFELVLHFVARLRDAVADTATRVILPVAPGAFTKRQLNLLEKEGTLIAQSIPLPGKNPFKGRKIP